MERQLRVMGNQLVIASGGICGIVFVILGFPAGIRFSSDAPNGHIPGRGGGALKDLPAAATINFALGIRKMRQHNVLVRHLQAIETLGAVQTVCLDKTGTITENRMTVVTCLCGLSAV